MAMAEGTSATEHRTELQQLVPALEIIVARGIGPGDDVRDAVQEVLTRALAAIDAGRVIRGPLGAFVHGIAMHVIVDIRRMRVRTERLGADLDTEVATSASALDSLVAAEEREAVRAALARLDDRDYQLLRRCFVDGVSVAELATEMGEPAPRLRKRKSRAMQRLRDLIRDGHISDADETKRA